MATITLEHAQRLANAALSQARLRNAPPMSVVIVDSDGSVRAAVREDHAAPAGVEIATAKARSSLAFNLASAKIAEIFGSNAATSAALASLLPGRFLPIGGAVLLVDSAGTRLGAMAGAGGAPDTDAAIVQEAIAQVHAPSCG